MRIVGDGDGVVILLHGLIGSGDMFGAAYDELATDTQLVIPDLLGFGRSQDERRNAYRLQDHLTALDEMATQLHLDARPLIIAGHSLGALLALHWATQRHDVAGVVCFSAPFYVDADEADDHIAAMGLKERLFAPQGAISHALCAWMCRHRTIAQWIAVASQPQLPLPVARNAVRHSWASYTGALNTVIRDGSWAAQLVALEHTDTPVLLADGARDPVTVPHRAAALATRHHNITTTTHPTANHLLTLTHPNWCVDILSSRLDAERGPPSD